MSSDKSLTNNRTIIFPSNSISTTTSHQQFIAVSVPVGHLNEEIMDAAFVKALSPETYPGGLQAMMTDHRFSDAVPLGKHWAYKYLVDMDGMGYSGRFMAFLASDSVPVKATVYEEFFSQIGFSLGCISSHSRPRIKRYTTFMPISRVLLVLHFRRLIQGGLNCHMRKADLLKGIDDYEGLREPGNNGRRQLEGLSIWKSMFIGCVWNGQGYGQMIETRWDSAFNNLADQGINLYQLTVSPSKRHRASNSKRFSQ